MQVNFLVMSLSLFYSSSTLCMEINRDPLINNKTPEYGKLITLISGDNEKFSLPSHAKNYSHLLKAAFEHSFLECQKNEFTFNDLDKTSTEIVQRLLLSLHRNDAKSFWELMEQFTGDEEIIENKRNLKKILNFIELTKPAYEKIKTGFMNNNIHFKIKAFVYDLLSADRYSCDLPLIREIAKDCRYSYYTQNYDEAMLYKNKGKDYSVGTGPVNTSYFSSSKSICYIIHDSTYYYDVTSFLSYDTDPEELRLLKSISDQSRSSKAVLTKEQYSLLKNIIYKLRLQFGLATTYKIIQRLNERLQEPLTEIFIAWYLISSYMFK